MPSDDLPDYQEGPPEQPMDEDRREDDTWENEDDQREWEDEHRAWDEPEVDDFEDPEVTVRPQPHLLQPDPCPDIDKETKTGVKTAHRNLAHPSREAFLRMLRLGGASEDAVKYAKHWTCPVCAEKQQLRSSRPAGMPRAEEFNDTVCIDLLEIKDVNGTRHDVVSIVDWASRYHMALITDGKSSREIAKTLAKHWMTAFGAPRQVMADQGGEFQGRFERLLEKNNID